MNCALVKLSARKTDKHRIPKKIDKENSEGNSTTAGEYILLVLHIIWKCLQTVLASNLASEKREPYII